MDSLFFSIPLYSSLFLSTNPGEHRRTERNREHPQSTQEHGKRKTTMLIPIFKSIPYKRLLKTLIRYVSRGLIGVISSLNFAGPPWPKIFVTALGTVAVWH
jgi:hypothetical protein